MCISDCTESAWCSAFDAAEFIFGKTAEQLNKMKEEDQTEFEVRKFFKHRRGKSASFVISMLFSI